MKKIIIIWFVLGLSLISKSQCLPNGVTGAFVVTNNGSCDITVLIETSDCCGPYLVTNFCATGPIVLIPGATWSPPASCLVTNCGSGDVLVCLLQIDYIDLVTGGGCAFGNSVSANTGIPGLSSSGTTAGGSVPAGTQPMCAPAGAASTWSMVWTPTGVTITF